VAPGLSIVVLAASLIAVVRRGEEGHRLTGELEAREAEAEVVADRIVAEQTRVESLTTLARIKKVAAPLGLRQAVDAELVQMRAGDDTQDANEYSGVGENR